MRNISKRAWIKWINKRGATKKIGENRKWNKKYEINNIGSSTSL